jgi:DNA-directed RNA polymerase specialized sigma24 family protein
MSGIPASRFHTTRWTLVLAAVEKPTADSRQALARLCEIYWHPVYAFIRRSGHDPEEAQDLTQGFFTLLVAKNYLQSADRERGRFRSFLLTAVKHYLANEWDRENALKRGGGQVRIPLDSLDLETWYKPAVVNEDTPEVLFQKRWALSLLDHVMTKLRVHYREAGKGEQFEVLSTFLNRNPNDPRYETVAAEAGTSAGALRMSAMRMRRKYREFLRAEIAETVTSPEDIDDEIRFLLSVLNA